MRDEHLADHGHDHNHGHQHSQNHPRGPGTRRVWAFIRHAVGLHSHSHDSGVDAVLEGSAQGMRALWISLAGLGATALAQAVVFGLSGSVALLGDALHNSADALTAVPLGIAFMIGRRRPPAGTPTATGRPRTWPGFHRGGDRSVVRRWPRLRPSSGCCAPVRSPT